jgi:hypothetical protein
MDENVIFIKETKVGSTIKIVLEKELISIKQYPERKNVVLELNVPSLPDASLPDASLPDASLPDASPLNLIENIFTSLEHL